MAAESSDLILECSELLAGYGGSTVLNNASLTVRNGQITGIIGPNGAGKSTLLKTILGYLKPISGSIAFAGRDITRWRPDQRIAAGLAYVAQSRSGFLTMTVRENLRLGAYLERDKAAIAERLDAVVERFPELRARMDKPASDLSGGQLRMLEIGRFLMQGPKMVILDEPSIGLAPRLVDVVYDEIVRLKDEGLTFLIVEQNVRKLFTVADYIFALETGRNRVGGTPEDLQKDGVLRSLYLGAPLGSTEAGQTKP